MSLPSEEVVGGALEYLSSTDVQYGQLMGAVKASEHQGKVAKSVAFLSATGTVAEKESKAYTSQEYMHWLESHQNIVADLEVIRAKRKRAELTIDVWRSLNASRRQGNI